MKRVVLLNDTSSELHHGCEVVISVIKDHVRRRGAKIIYSSRVGADWAKDDYCRNAIQNCDAVIVNGEGTIHHGRQNGMRLLEVAPFCKSHGISSFLINATYDSNPISFSELLRAFNGIFVREEFSQNQIGELGIHANRVPDLTLDLARRRITKQRSTGEILVSDSAFADLSTRLLRIAKERRWRFLPIIRSSTTHGANSAIEIIRHLKFKAHNIGMRYLHRKEHLNYLEARNLYAITSTDAFLQTIAEAQGLITGRFHAMCFAICLETPFIAISGNSHKIQSVLSELQMTHRISTIDDIERDSPEHIPEFDEGEKKALARYRRLAIDSIDHMFDTILGRTASPP